MINGEYDAINRGMETKNAEWIPQTKIKKNTFISPKSHFAYEFCIILSYENKTCLIASWHISFGPRRRQQSPLSEGWIRVSMACAVHIFGEVPDGLDRMGSWHSRWQWDQRHWNATIVVFSRDVTKTQVSVTRNYYLLMLVFYSCTTNMLR